MERISKEYSHPRWIGYSLARLFPTLLWSIAISDAGSDRYIPRHSRRSLIIILSDKRRRFLPIPSETDDDSSAIDIESDDVHSLLRYTPHHPPARNFDNQNLRPSHHQLRRFEVGDTRAESEYGQDCTDSVLGAQSGIAIRERVEQRLYFRVDLASASVSGESTHRYM